MEIPERLLENDTVHRRICRDVNNATLFSGRLRHKHRQSINEKVCFKYYGAFFLLSGEGVYIDELGNKTLIYLGCYVQRNPYHKHSTIVKEEGKWRDYFICFGYDIIVY